jgi:hypothetical protein
MKDNCPVCEKMQRKYIVKMDEIICHTKAIVGALYDTNDLEPQELEYDIHDLCFSLGISMPAGKIQVQRKKAAGENKFVEKIKNTKTWRCSHDLLQSI